MRRLVALAPAAALAAGCASPPPPRVPGFPPPAELARERVPPLEAPPPRDELIAEPARLRYALEPGARLRYRDVGRGEIESAVAAQVEDRSEGEPQPVDRFELERVWTVDVVDAAPGELTLEVSLAHVRGAGPDAAAYDSTAGAAPEAPRWVAHARAVGRPFTVRLHPSGEVIELLGAEELFAAATEGLSEDLRRDLEPLVGPQGLRALVRRLFPRYPPGEVAPGAPGPVRRLKVGRSGGMTVETAQEWLYLGQVDRGAGRAAVLWLRQASAPAVRRIDDDRGAGQAVVGASVEEGFAYVRLADGALLSWGPRDTQIEVVTEAAVGDVAGAFGLRTRGEAFTELVD